MTPGQAIRNRCLQCLDCSIYHAYDCGCGTCPLYAAHPFRGKRMVTARAPESGERKSELARIEKLHTTCPKRKPSRAIIAAACRLCQPETRDDCGATDCGLYPYCPFQPGGVPKRAQSDKQRYALSGAIARMQKNACYDA